MDSDAIHLDIASSSRSLDLGVEIEPTRATDPYAELIPMAVAGDRRAIERLLRALAPRILGAARAVLGPRHPDLDDLVQESMVALVRALPAFETRSTIAHYAARITVRVCIHGRRRARAEQRLDTDAHAALSADTTGSRPYRQLLRERRRALVRLLLDDLPRARPSPSGSVSACPWRRSPR
jgi:RNA polymerase sigma factor (sigma-70 family)